MFKSKPRADSPIEIAVSGTAVPGSDSEHDEVGEKYEMSEHVESRLGCKQDVAELRRTARNDGMTGLRKLEKEVVRLSVGIGVARTLSSWQSIAPILEDPP